MRLTANVAVLVLLVNVVCAGRAPVILDQSPDVAAAREVVIAVMNFREGDAEALNRARSAFTVEGWQSFMETMEGFLDDKGASTFTSTFVAREARVLETQNGVLHLRIPGRLTQSNRLGKTTYERFAVDAYLIQDAGAIKIRRLEQVTCRGASTECV